MDISQSIMMTIITAATPLLLAALGEVIVERSGVLNLGLEGMMATAAASGFAMAILSGSTIIGVFCAVASAVMLSALFGFATLGLGANQVASGLALTIVGLGLSGLIGAGFVGTSRPPLQPFFIEGLTDLPGFGKILFGQDIFVYTSWLLIIAILIYLNLTRAGLSLRCIGENHHSAHAIGLPVLKTRFRAVLFGGACAGLAGAYLSLVYTPFWSPGMTAGRGWIALSLVVFAAWRAERVLLGALLFGGATVLQLHAQAASLGLPSQLLSAVPYLATLVALVLMSLGRKSGTVTPGSLGQPFVPER